jgi:hypothetical protein
MHSFEGENVHGSLHGEIFFQTHAILRDFIHIANL